MERYIILHSSLPYRLILLSVKIRQVTNYLDNDLYAVDHSESFSQPALSSHDEAPSLLSSS